MMEDGAPQRELMRALATGEAVDRAHLAACARLDAAGVSTCIEALRDAGVPILGGGDGGYRLAWPTRLLDAAAITEHAGGEAAAPIEVCWAVDSTSAELARRGHRMPDLAVLLAETQSAGRGRRGRTWYSPPGYNLYLSCRKHFACELAGLAGLSLSVGVAVARALEALGIVNTGLKWPNDVVVQGAKLAGILVELAGQAQGVTAVVGIGLNVRLPARARAGVDQPVTDLAALCDERPPERNVLAARLITSLRAALLEFETRGFAAFADAFARRDVLRGRSLRLDGVAGACAGTGAGVDCRGALQVRRGQEVVRVDSAQVSVRAR